MNHQGYDAHSSEGFSGLAHYQKFVKNLTADNIIECSIVPTPDLAQYTVPGVERWYLVGPPTSGRRCLRSPSRDSDANI